MTPQKVTVRELAGWDLDAYAYRPAAVDAMQLAAVRSLVDERAPYALADVLLPSTPAATAALLADHASREDLHDEMAGLQWHLGMVDLRGLIAFQRRLSFHPLLPAIAVPAQQDEAALIRLCFGSPRPIQYAIAPIEAGVTLTLETRDPNLHLRSSSSGASPLVVHGGSPFFEVARYRGRWFLRDGYHRAYALLCAGVFRVPAVVVEARTLEELGAGQPWFFAEETLLSRAPPRVLDFLNDRLVLTYDRPELLKTLRVTIEESFAPAVPQGDPS